MANKKIGATIALEGEKEFVERCTILGGSFKIIGIKLASADCNGKASLKYCL